MILTSFAILIHLAVDVSLLYVVNENAQEEKSHSVIVRWYLFSATLYTPCARVTTPMPLFWQTN